MRRGIAAGAGVVAAAGAFVGLYRPWHLRWGANDAEVRMAMPGDDAIERPAFNGTRAITIGASGEDVWPWIVQVGFGRAGFYSYDLLDNLGKPSAERIIPELQDVQVGTWIPMAGLVNDETAFKVAGFAPNDWMLWTKAASTWAWRLIPTEDGRTRLITRVRCQYRWTRPTIITDLLLMELGDFPMIQKMLRGIKRRAEALAAERRGSLGRRTGGD